MLVIADADRRRSSSPASWAARTRASTKRRPRSSSRARSSSGVDPRDLAPLGLSSDSSYRYERGVDPHCALEAARRAIDLIVETAGGGSVGARLRGRGRRALEARDRVTSGFVTSGWASRSPDRPR
jgi:hypothetical protein